MTLNKITSIALFLTVLATNITTFAVINTNKSKAIPKTTKTKPNAQSKLVSLSTTNKKSKIKPYLISNSIPDNKAFKNAVNAILENTGICTGYKGQTAKHCNSNIAIGESDLLQDVYGKRAKTVTSNLSKDEVVCISTKRVNKLITCGKFIKSIDAKLIKLDPFDVSTETNNPTTHLIKLTGLYSLSGESVIEQRDGKGDSGSPCFSSKGFIGVLSFSLPQENQIGCVFKG
jgi:hypothetical protein